MFTKDFDMQVDIDLAITNLFINSSKHSFFPSEVKVSMMTIGVATGCVLPSLACMDDNFVSKLVADPRFEFKSLSGHGDCPHANFSNCRVLRLFYNNANKYILIFCNGSIQIAGCKSVLDASFLTDVIVCALGFSGIRDESATVSIRMFNTNFSLGCGVNTQALFESVSPIIPKTIFDTKRSSGVNIPFMVDTKKVAIIVFPKGNIVMTGANDITQVVKAYEFITSHIQSKFSSLTFQFIEVVKVPKKRGRKRKADQEDVYNNILL